MANKTDLTVAGYIFRGDSLDFKPELLLIKHRKLGLWLPVGGHVNVRKNETPPEAMVREAREEVGLDINLLMDSSEYKTISEIEKCASSFHSDIHSVGNHNHYCQFYICEAPGDQIVSVNEREISASRWLSETGLGISFGLNKNNLAYLAFEKYKEMKK